MGAVLVCVFAAIDQEKNHENELAGYFFAENHPATIRGTQVCRAVMRPLVRPLTFQMSAAAGSLGVAAAHASDARQAGP